MNYTKIYNAIIESAKSRQIEGYKEKHHILPLSLGGTNDKKNLVDLSAREHFICHYLLTKIYDKTTVEYYKMLNAFIMMKCSNTIQLRYFNSHLYESKRVEYSKMVSIRQTGVKNSQYGSVWIYNLDLKKSKKIQKKELIIWLSKGWLLGRKLNFDTCIVTKLAEQEKRKVETPRQIELKKIKKLEKEKRKAETLRKNELKKIKKSDDTKRKQEEKKKQNIEKYTKLYKIYESVGFKKFVELTNYEYTLESLVYQFKIYVESFIPQSRKKRGK